MNRWMTAAGCAALGLLIAQPAMAACSLKTQPITIKLLAFRPTVDVKVNGKPATFLLSTVAPVNLVSSKFAAAQKLASAGAGANGATVVKATQFEFAGATLKDVPLVESNALSDVDGAIGQSILHQGDVEYDLGGGKVQLAKAEGCDTVDMAYWVKEGQTYYIMPLAPAGNDLATKTEVVVNDVKLRATFNTGIPYTIISEKAAEKAGVKVTDQGVKPLDQTGSTKTWIGTFADVKIGDEDIKNAPLEITRTNDDYDVMLGADFFSAHHLYVSNSQQKIFFTAFVPPGPPPRPGDPAISVFKVHPPEANGMNTGRDSQGRLDTHGF
jgi:hypothetical protein